MRTAIARAGILAGIAAAVLATTAAAAPATTTSATHVKAAAADDSFVLVGHNVSSHVSDFGPKGVSPGDTSQLSESMSFEGMLVGTGFSSCTLVTRGVAECTRSWNFGKLGSIQAQGAVPYRVAPGRAVVLAVTGGTVQFEGVGGTVRIGSTGTKNSPEAFHLVNLPVMVPMLRGRF